MAQKNGYFQLDIKEACVKMKYFPPVRRLRTQEQCCCRNKHKGQMKLNCHIFDSAFSRHAFRFLHYKQIVERKFLSFSWFFLLIFCVRDKKIALTGIVRTFPALSPAKKHKLRCAAGLLTQASSEKRAFRVIPWLFALPSAITVVAAVGDLHPASRRTVTLPALHRTGWNDCIIDPRLPVVKGRQVSVQQRTEGGQRQAQQAP